MLSKFSLAFGTSRHMDLHVDLLSQSFESCCVNVPGAFLGGFN